MEQYLNTLKFILPFMELVVFFCLYGKTYSFMKKYYCNMTLFRSARKFYSLCLMVMLVLINWSCCMTDQNYAVGFAALVSMSFFSYRVTDIVLLKLKTKKTLFFITMVLSMICFAVPYLNSLFHVLYTVGIASAFYPSQRLLKITKEEWMKMDRQRIQDKIIKEYN